MGPSSRIIIKQLETCHIYEDISYLFLFYAYQGDTIS